MANWLDKYEQGGMVLKQKTKDNYGKKPNANNSEVSLPPGFKGLAYNTKGRNYSPAWGGQFAMGGTLPGAVGFTYARTQNPAPSNGPYAKKTKASAQNGKEMKYYQEGLDFKPKTISQDGKLLPKWQQKLNQETAKLDDPFSVFSLMKKGYSKSTATQMNEAAAKAITNQPQVAPSSKSINIEERNRKNKAYAQQYGKKYDESTGAVKPLVSDKTQKVLDRVMTNFVEPAIMISPVGELGMAADAFRLAKAAAPIVKSAAKDVSENIALNTASSLYKFSQKLSPGAPREHLSGIAYGIADISRGRPFFEAFPITRSQKLKVEAAQDKAFKEGVSFVEDWFYPGDVWGISPQVERRIENIFPDLYSAPTNINSFKENPFNTTKNLLVSTRSSDLLKNRDLSDFSKNEILKTRGTNTGFNTGEESITYRNKGFYYNKPSAVRETAAHEAGHTSQHLGHQYEDSFGQLYNYRGWGNEIATSHSDYKYRIPNTQTAFGQKMADAMVPPIKGEKVWAASPLEPHSELMVARMKAYGDLIKKGVDPKEAISLLQNPSDELVDFMIEDQKLNRFFKKTTSQEVKRDILRNLPAAVPAVGVGIGAAALQNQQPSKQKNGGWLSKYEEGGVIKDDMGQWAHPGEITEIGSNQITMEGVPYPVLGISDTGDVQMMYPEEDYTFDGESVTEYPIAKSGMSVNNADAQPIEKLDQLLNFTNYNKPTKGGWLEKYNDGGEIPSDIKYDIQKGDTLSNISSRYNVPLATLANANQLENPNLIQAGKKLNIPTQAKKELTFEEIPTSDNKKVVIDNFSKHYDYIVEGNNVYYKTKGGKTWADISDNKTAQSNLLKFLDKNNYWTGYNSGEKELLKTGQVPKKQQAQVDLPKLTPIKTRAAADATQVTKGLTKPVSKSTVKEEPSVFDDMTNYLKSEVKSIGGKAKKIEKQVESAVGEVKKSVESGFNNAVQTVEDLYQTGINGIKRKIATHTGEDDDVKVSIPKINKPKTVTEYYGNKTGAEISAVVDVPDGSGRQYKQQVLPTSSIKFGIRNRGEYKDIKTEGLEITTFNPFTKDKLPDNTTVLAIDPSGNLHTGVYKDFKNQKGFMFSKTFRNKIVDFAESNGKAEYVSGEKSGNPKYNQPKVKVMNDNGKIIDGSLNILVKDDSKKDYYGSVQGGRILFVNPETKEQYLVSGSMNHIKNEFRRIKGNNKYLEAYTLDNGTYSRGLSYKDKKLTPERLKKYDLENTGGGNGLFIMDYKQPISKFREEYVEGMPNVRTEKDQSYKKGHPLRNEIKNVVLHHTAYTGPNAEKEVTAQYMTPGQNTSHIVIQKDGRRTVYASPEQVTFHAGESKWNNRDNVNDFSIGVEFQGDTNKKPLTQAQVESFVEYYIPIAKKYNLSLKDIITHQMVAPGRKPDISEKEYQRILKYMRDNNLK